MLHPVAGEQFGMVVIKSEREPYGELSSRILDLFHDPWLQGKTFGGYVKL
jgi:hypothetical protein